MNSAPSERLIQPIAPADCRMPPAAFAAKAARPRHQSVPPVMKISPSTRKAS
ncbi:hypothetical protein chiPu_0032529, partial [Chiloscyllium punctatum]|nr:hypothetical protein [Chiloscyllium punctatum]